MSRLQILLGIFTLGNIVHQQKLTCISYSFSNNLNAEIAYESYITNKVG